MIGGGPYSVAKCASGDSGSTVAAFGLIPALTTFTGWRMWITAWATLTHRIAAAPSQMKTGRSKKRGRPGGSGYARGPGGGANTSASTASSTTGRANSS